MRIRLWDLPTRIFHWSLVVLVVLAVVSGEIGGKIIVWHGRIGLAILGLLTFRLAWGFVGSTTARFAQFFPTPTSVRSYLRGEWRGLGHNPLGAFSVFGLLALLAVQVGTGLFANDDIAFNGPLSGLITKSFSDRMGGLHETSVVLLLALIALHVGAIAFYARVKKDNLVLPMITGMKEVETESAKATRGGGLLALIFALVIASAAVYGGSGAWIPTPQLAPSAETPAW